MALLFMDGFDANDFSMKWLSNGANTSASTRYGSGLALSLGQANIKRAIPASAQIFAGYAYDMTGYVNGGIVIYGDNGTTAHLSVDLASNQVELRAGSFGSILASTPNTYFTNTWYYIEIMATLATSGGQCQVKVNGVQVINFTGNTMNGGTSTSIDSVALLSTGQFGPPALLFDDFYVCDATGAANNTFLGDVRVQTLKPTGVGSSTLLTPTGSANNWQNVDDVPDSASTYNSSATVGARDTYAMGDVLASTGTIFGTQDNMHAYKTDAGSANMKAALLSGATLAYDATQALGATNTWSGAVRETDPNTSASWTPTGVNAIEFGGEVA